MSKRILAWKFIGKDHKLRFKDGRELVAGATLKEPLDGHGRVITLPVPCEHGFHASIRPLDALGFADADQVHIARVELAGATASQDDKVCATEVTTLWLADAEKALHEFAVWCGWRALEVAFPNGDAPLASILALQVKELWLRGEADNEDLDAAWDAASDAARAAARAAARDAACAAARDAAWAAACAAAWDAARDAARDAAWDAASAAASAAARDAAWDAARAAASAAQNTELERRLSTLEPAKTKAA